MKLDPTNQALEALLASTRKQPQTASVELPADYMAAASAVRAALCSDDPKTIENAFSAMAARNAVLTGSPDALAAALATQVQILETLFLRNIVKAERAANADHRFLFMKTALSCQRQSVQAMSAIFTIQQGRNHGA